MDTINKPAAPAPDEDLSRDIIATVTRLPEEIVRCTRVNGSFYRCNWWSAAETQGYDNPAMKAGQVGTTHRISRSEFLQVIRSEGGLKIAVVSQNR